MTFECLEAIDFPGGWKIIDRFEASKNDGIIHRMYCLICVNIPTFLNLICVFNFNCACFTVITPTDHSLAKSTKSDP